MSLPFRTLLPSLASSRALGTSVREFLAVVIPAVIVIITLTHPAGPL